MYQLGLTDIYRTFHHKTRIFNIFSSAHRTLSWIELILGHKSSLGKLKKKSVIISSIFSDHIPVRLDVNYRTKLVDVIEFQLSYFKS